MFNIHHSSDKCFLITTHCTSSADISWVREKDVLFFSMSWRIRAGGGGVEDRMGKKELLFLVKMLTLKWIKYCWEKQSINKSINVRKRNSSFFFFLLWESRFRLFQNWKLLFYLLASIISRQTGKRSGTFLFI